MRLLSVDPGVRGCGVALFSDGQLVSAAYVSSPGPRVNMLNDAAVLAYHVSEFYQSRIPWITDLVVEIPRVYPAARQKGDQNDLIAVAGVAYAIAGRMGSHIEKHMYFPREWKGTVDADEVMLPRIKGRLSAEEKPRIIPVRESLMHNVYDAIGIGLKKLGRLEPVRIIARGK